MKDSVFKVILKYKNHPTIIQIRKTRENGIFYFKEVTIEEIENEINGFSSKKAPKYGDNSTRIIQEYADILGLFL